MRKWFGSEYFKEKEVHENTCVASMLFVLENFSIKKAYEQRTFRISLYPKEVEFPNCTVEFKIKNILYIIYTGLLED